MSAEPDAFNLDDLNPAQREAVLFGDGPFRIIAGAGTGKTRTLTTRFVHLVTKRGVPAHQVLALTFSTKAAEEMRSRVQVQLPGSHRKLWIQTFHSLCLSLIREWSLERGEPRPNVIDDAGRINFAAQAVRSVLDAQLRVHRGEAGRRKLTLDLLTMVDRAKDDLRTPDDVMALARDPVQGSDRLHDLAISYAAYQEQMRCANSRDFGDLALDVVSRLGADPDLRETTRSRFRHVLVDEFQDTNLAQFELMRLIAPRDGNVCVVGDANQAIYGFRGGRAEYMSRFESYFPGAATIQLTANYRSGREILDAANRLIKHDPGRVDFELVPANPADQAVLTLTDARTPDAEAELIARQISALAHDPVAPRTYSEIAVLFRSVKNSAEPLLRALRLRGIPFSLGPKSVIEFDVVQDVLAVLRLVIGPTSWSDAARLAIMRGAAGSDCQTLERKWDEPARTDALTGDAPDEALPLGEQMVLDFSREVVRDACELRNLPLSMLLYRAIALTGNLTERLDPETARMLRVWIEQANALSETGATAEDLLRHLSAGQSRDEDDVPDNPGGVRILTVHASKGLEWPVVFVAGMAETIFPVPMRLDREFDVYDLSLAAGGDRKSGGGSEAERAVAYRQEERRLAYVAVTRARHELHITVPLSNDKGPLSRSMFISELGLDDHFPSLADDNQERQPTSVQELRRRLRAQQLRALAAMTDDPMASEAIATLLLTQWAATGVVPGAVPLRQRGIPEPNDAATALTFSFSQVDTYEKCPRQYLYQSVLHLNKDNTSPALSLGNGVHNALKVLNTQWQAARDFPDDDEIYDAIEQAWPSVGFDCVPQSAQQKMRARAMVRRFFEQEAARSPLRYPVEIESRISAKVGTHTLTGRVDLIVSSEDGHAEIIDFKTGSPSGLSPKESLQLYLYALAWLQRGPAVPQPSVAYMVLRHDDDKGFQTGEAWKTKQEKVINHTPELTEALGNRLDEILNRILANDFAPNPEERRCSVCTFRWICPEG